jgi:transcriptional regulator with XRE-family HTH domain
MIDSKAIGARIRSAREELGITLEALGEEFHLSVSAMSNRETGEKELSAVDIALYCIYLKKSPNYFILGLSDKYFAIYIVLINLIVLGVEEGFIKLENDLFNLRKYINKLIEVFGIMGTRWSDICEKVVCRGHELFDLMKLSASHQNALDRGKLKMYQTITFCYLALVIFLISYQELPAFARGIPLLPSIFFLVFFSVRTKSSIESILDLVDGKKRKRSKFIHHESWRKRATEKCA